MKKPNRVPWKKKRMTCCLVSWEVLGRNKTQKREDMEHLAMKNSGEM
jgi:hypothetical protein